MQPLRAVLFVLLGLCAVEPANAEIILSPLRQVITPQAPVATYRVSNPSARIVEGRLSWIDLAATETGYEPANAETRAKTSAAPYLEVEPADFRLNPGESATITVTLRRPPPGPGEWRSHLLIATEAARSPLRRTSGSLQVDIGLGVSTPVILRAGKGEAAAKIGETRLIRGADGLIELETHLEPQGDFSAFGGIEVYFTPEGGARSLMRKVENVAAYVDAPSRRVVAPLGVKSLPGGDLEVRYVGRAEFEGRLFAKRNFAVSPPSAP
ncbi:MAG TPA: hypothetical protein VNH64_03825 [Parvularculaceae bacterium]|nr:hypothetical protein [Parvularculaceae bacterium]